MTEPATAGIAVVARRLTIVLSACCGVWGCASTPPAASPCPAVQVAPPVPPTPAAPLVLSVTKAERDHLFLVIYRPGPSWVAGKHVTEQPLAEHFRYLVSLYAAGTLKGAGPFTDDAGGATLIDAANLDAASSILARDPAVVSGVMTAEAHPFRPLDWAAQVKTPKRE